MTTIYVALGSAIFLGLAVALWWRLSAPGKKLRFGDFTLYYTPAITSEVANQVAQYLIQQNFSDQSMDARITREGATYQLQLICTGQPVESQVIACEALAAGLSDDVFAGAAVEIQVCDRIFRPICVIPHQGRFGRRITMNAAHLFYLEGVTDSEALDVANFLAGIGVFDDSPKIAQMNRSADGYEFRLAVEVDPLAPEMVKGARQMATELSPVLGRTPVTVHFCKGLLGTLRAVQPLSAGHGPYDCHVPGGPYRTEILCLPGEPLDGSTIREEKRDR